MEGKIYNLEERALEFSKRILKLIKVLPKDPISNHYASQINRSATSIGVNYREANDALVKKDFIHRIKISRKKSKEITYWLELIEKNNQKLKEEMVDLKKESIELTKILSKIITNSQDKQKQM